MVIVHFIYTSFYQGFFFSPSLKRTTFYFHFLLRMVLTYYEKDNSNKLSLTTTKEWCPWKSLPKHSTRLEKRPTTPVIMKRQLAMPRLFWLVPLRCVERKCNRYPFLLVLIPFSYCEYSFPEMYLIFFSTLDLSYVIFSANINQTSLSGKR